jgi:hypothetical protein
MLTLNFKKRVIRVSMMSAFLVLLVIAVFHFRPSSHTSRNQSQEGARSAGWNGKRSERTSGLAGRIPRSAATSIPGLPERDCILRNELLRDPDSAWKMLKKWRGEGVDSGTISLITAAVFWDDTEGMAEAISSWPASQASSAWVGCMRNAMDQAKAGKAPVEVLKVIKLIPAHHAASDFAYGRLPEAFLAAGFDPGLLLESIKTHGSISNPELKKLNPENTRS